MHILQKEGGPRASGLLMIKDIYRRPVDHELLGIGWQRLRPQNQLLRFGWAQLRLQTRDLRGNDGDCRRDPDL